MPKAVIPNHSEVEKFLRSSESHFTYPICIDHFREFKKDLGQTGPLIKFSVSVSDWNPLSSNCKLEKTIEYHQSVAESFRRLTLEMGDVQKFRQSLRPEPCGTQTFREKAFGIRFLVDDVG
jgi:hypothetical protein